jgi:ankyrin repeat protein
MKNYRALTILLWISCTPFAIQQSEAQQPPDKMKASTPEQAAVESGDSQAQQTPDMVEEPGKTGTPATARTNVLPQVAEPMEPREKALYQAVFAGNLPEVKAIVTKGASVNFADEEQRTPLILAAYNGYTPIVEFLVSKGADVNVADHDGMTALMYTAKRSFNETAAFLLNNGAEVNVRSRKRGMTALMLAAGWGNAELVKMLLDKGADPAIHDYFGETAADHAGKMRHENVVKMLSGSPAPK